MRENRLCSLLLSFLPLTRQAKKHSFCLFPLSLLLQKTHSCPPLHSQIPWKSTLDSHSPCYFVFLGRGEGVGVQTLTWYDKSCLETFIVSRQDWASLIITLSAKQSNPQSLCYQLPGRYQIHAIFTYKGIMSHFRPHAHTAFHQTMLENAPPWGRKPSPNLETTNQMLGWHNKEFSIQAGGKQPCCSGSTQIWFCTTWATNNPGRFGTSVWNESVVCSCKVLSVELWAECKW